MKLGDGSERVRKALVSHVQKSLHKNRILQRKKKRGNKWENCAKNRGNFSYSQNGGLIRFIVGNFFENSLDVFRLAFLFDCVDEFGGYHTSHCVFRLGYSFVFECGVWLVWSEATEGFGNTVHHSLMIRKSEKKRDFEEESMMGIECSQSSSALSQRTKEEGSKQGSSGKRPRKKNGKIRICEVYLRQRNKTSLINLGLGCSGSSLKESSQSSQDHLNWKLLKW